LHPDSFLADCFFGRKQSINQIVSQDALLKFESIHRSCHCQSHFIHESGFGWGVFEKIKTASPKAIPYIFTHKLFQRASFLNREEAAARYHKIGSLKIKNEGWQAVHKRL